MSSQDNEWYKIASREIKIEKVQKGDHVYMRRGIYRYHGIVVEASKDKTLFVLSPEIPDGAMSLKDFAASGGTLCRSGYGCGSIAKVQVRGVAQQFLRDAPEVVMARAVCEPPAGTDVIDWCISCMAYLPDGSTVAAGKEAALIFSEDGCLVAYVMSNDSITRKERLCTFIKQNTLQVVNVSMTSDKAAKLHEQLLGNALNLDKTPFNFTPTTNINEAIENNVALTWVNMGKLGAGGFGTVYKGQSSEGLIMAVKVMQVSEDDAKKYCEIIDTVDGLAHPNIVRFYGHQLRDVPAVGGGGAKEVQLEIFMELCSTTLEGIIAVHKRAMPLALVRRYATEILTGLKCLHDHKIIHRDLKPGNVLLNVEGAARLADFDISKNVSLGPAKTIVGTPPYMAPEMLKKLFELQGAGGILAGLVAALCPTHFSDRVDVWSFGCLVVNMLGQPTMAWASEKQLFDTDDLPPALTAYPTLPPSLAAMLRKCFVRDFKARASVDELLADPWITCPESQLNA